MVREEKQGQRREAGIQKRKGNRDNKRGVSREKENQNEKVAEGLLKRHIKYREGNLAHKKT